MSRQGPDGAPLKRTTDGKLTRADGMSRWAIPAHTSEAEALTWNDAPPGVLLDLIDMVTSAGAAISFSKLRNANGVSITILDGADRPKHYARTHDELENLLRRLLAAG